VPTSTALPPRQPSAEPSAAGLSVAAAYALFVRLALWGVTMATLPMPHFRQPAPPPSPDLWRLWSEWDGVWYRGIALHGYGWSRYDWAYFPLYPVLVRAVSPLAGHDLALAGIVVSLAASVGAFALLYRRVAESDGPEAGERAVRYLALFPTAFFLAMGYSEATFLFFALLALRAAGRGRPALAAAAGFAAALTRSAGACLAPAVAWAFWSSGRPRGAWAAVGPAAGLLAFAGYAAWQAHDPLAFVHAQYHWSRHLTWPWAAVAAAVRDVRSGIHPWRNLLDLTTVVAVAVTLASGNRALRPEERVYAWLAWGLMVAAPARPGHLSVFLSATRLALAVFPAFVVLAHWGARPAVDRAVTVISPLLQAAAFVLFSHSYFVA
jgi:hypothetical protein